MGPIIKFKQHIGENRWQYLIITLIFLAGVLTGNYKAEGLESGVKSHLLSLIDNYLKGGIQAGLNDQGILFNSFLNQAKSILIIWFLGLTIIGLPFILGWVFFRGFSLGFTIGFLVQEKAGAGVLISILSILPQNIVYIPVFIIWAVAALNFSLFIARGRAPGITNLSRALIAYSFFMLFFLGLALMGAFIEAYLSPWFLSLFL